MRLWTQAEDEAVRVFGANLRDLLLAAPAGARATMGLDPGFRTGVKVAVVDATGKVVATTAIYPHEPQRRWDESLAALAALCVHHKVELIAIGNGTASRRLWSHRAKRWRNSGWRHYPTKRLRGEGVQAGRASSH